MRIKHIFDNHIEKGLGTYKIDYEKNERCYFFGSQHFLMRFNRDYEIEDVLFLQHSTPHTAMI